MRVSFFNRRPPAHLRKQGSSSRTLRSSSEYYRRRSAPDPKARSAFLGVRGPSSRHPPSASNAPSHSHLPGALPPTTFLTSSTVSSAVGFVGLFHPTATSRVHSSGVLLLVRSRIGFHRPLPSRRCPDSADGSCPPPPLRRASPSGLCSASKSVTQYPGVSRVPSPIPLLSFASSRFSRRQF